MKKISLEEALRKPVQKPSLNVFEQWRTLQDRESEPEIQIKTVLNEIGEVVQVRLKGTNLVNRGLRLSTDPVFGAARFHLEGQTYSDVEQVPDLDVQELFSCEYQRMGVALDCFESEIVSEAIDKGIAFVQWQESMLGSRGDHLLNIVQA